MRVMKQMLFPFFILLVLGVYISLSSTVEANKARQEAKLMPTMPVQVFQVIGHTYMQQMIADILFIKVAVFYGGGEGFAKNVDAMANHFVAMQELNPKMIDVYYRTEAALVDHGDTYVRIANGILSDGRVALPSEVALPYFEGFNHYYYLDEPLKAAELLRIASEYDEKFQWLGHLASTLLAKGGSIRAGLTWLKGMYASMEEGEEKERYAKDIIDYEKALVIQHALTAYQQQKGSYPNTLQALMPNFLKTIPQVSDKFYIEYEAPNLYLKVKNSKEKKA